MARAVPVNAGSFRVHSGRWISREADGAGLCAGCRERHAGVVLNGAGLMAKGLRSFAVVERFLAKIKGDSRRPGYVLLGDEAFLYEMCRRGVLETLVSPDLRDFSVHNIDLGDTTIYEALDLAQTPSLMA